MTDYAAQIRHACYDYVDLMQRLGGRRLNVKEQKRVVADVDLIAMSIARVDSREWVRDSVVDQAGRALDALTDAVRDEQDVKELIERIAASAPGWPPRTRVNGCPAGR